MISETLLGFFSQKNYIARSDNKLHHFNVGNNYFKNQFFPFDYDTIEHYGSINS